MYNVGNEILTSYIGIIISRFLGDPVMNEPVQMGCHNGFVSVVHLVFVSADAK